MPEDGSVSVEKVEQRLDSGEAEKPIRNDDRPEENVVIEAQRKQRKAEKEAESFRKRIEELEDRDRSEAEKLSKRAEEAENRARELEERSVSLEKGAWIRAAANDFHDPQDAVLRANLSDIENEREAQRFVKDLAKNAPHLVKPADDGPPQIGRVLKDGERTNPTRDPGNRQEQETEFAQGLAAALHRVSESNKL
jgi:hypothetical protein